MAIAEDIYARCRVCTNEAATLLTDLLNSEKPDPMTVQARRTAADIAGNAIYALLRHAFITPIEREDLWLLRETAERVWRTAEDTALLLYHCEQPLPPACEPVVCMAITCCTVAKQLAEAFPNVESIPKQMRLLREAEYTYHAALRTCFADDAARSLCEGVYRVITACEQFIAVLRYVAMKNE